MKLILRWIILSVAVFLTTKIISGVYVDPLWVSLIVGACLALVNMFIKPIISILTLPLNILTLGIFSLLVNGFIFWILGSGVINGFSVIGFYSAFVGSLLISILNWILSKVVHFE